MPLCWDPGAWLKDACARAGRTVTIVSPWLSAGPVSAVLEAVPAHVPLRFVLRWPADAADAGPLDPGAVTRLLEAARARPLSVEYVERGLHAKVFAVDDRALISSANLTDAGLHRNLELGEVVQVDAALCSWLDGLPTAPLDEGAGAILLAGLASSSAGTAAAFPRPPAPRRGRIALVRDALACCGIEARHVPTGFGQNTWTAALFRRRDARVKAQVSTGADGVFHFKVSREDDRRLKAGEIHGLALAPYSSDGDGMAPAPGAPRLVLVSKAALYAPGGLGAGALRGHDALALQLRRGGRGWRLRIPNAGGRGGREATAHLTADRRCAALLRCQPASWR